MTSPKIAVYSLPGISSVPNHQHSFPNNLDLKNTTDDALPNYLTSLRFEQSHFLTDVRLGLGYTAVAIAAITFYFDYKLGWDETKSYTLWAVVLYFILNSTLTYWIWGIEKGKVFVGESNGSLVHALDLTGNPLLLAKIDRYQLPPM